jgi:hypothetical protein
MPSIELYVASVLLFIYSIAFVGKADEPLKLASDARIITPVLCTLLLA